MQEATDYQGLQKLFLFIAVFFDQSRKQGRKAHITMAHLRYSEVFTAMTEDHQAAVM